MDGLRAAHRRGPGFPPGGELVTSPSQVREPGTGLRCRWAGGRLRLLVRRVGLDAPFDAAANAVQCVEQLVVMVGHGVADGGLTAVNGGEPDRKQREQPCGGVDDVMVQPCDLVQPVQVF